MNFALLASSALSLILLAAHFLRGGHIALLAVALAGAALLGVRRPWAARALQVVLVLGAAEWMRTLLSLVAERQAEGRPFVRMGVILGTIAFLSLLSAAAFATRGIKTRFGIGTTPPFRLS